MGYLIMLIITLIGDFSTYHRSTNTHTEKVNLILISDIYKTANMVVNAFLICGIILKKVVHMNHSYRIIMSFVLFTFTASCTSVKPTTKVEPTTAPSTTTAPTIPGPTDTPAPIPTLAPPPTSVFTKPPDPTFVAETGTAPVQEEATQTPTELPLGSRPRIIPIENTNCHIRPGKDPNIVGYFLKGMESEIFGKDSTGDWVLIPNPNRAGEFCWVWTGYVQIFGVMDTVLVIP